MNEIIKIIDNTRCVIGEAPIWNERENALYYTNGGGREICKYDMKNDSFSIISVEKDCAAFAFCRDGGMLVSRSDGVFKLFTDGTTKEICDTAKFGIRNANDMKVGCDGRLYVGTQSERRLGISSKLDGKLYSIDKNGNVRILLDGMSLSNGMEWSLDEKYFYHTDSDTGIIKEYAFDSENGDISFTGKNIAVPGVDGFTVDSSGRLFVACWGKGHIAVVDTENAKIERYIELPCKIPASCAFVGKEYDILAVTTASFDTDLSSDKNAGYTILLKCGAYGRKPYLFG